MSVLLQLELESRRKYFQANGLGVSTSVWLQLELEFRRKYFQINTLRIYVFLLFQSHIVCS
jgi:hypothetical protein